ALEVQIGIGCQARLGTGDMSMEDTEAVVAVADAGVAELVPDEGILGVRSGRCGEVAALEVVAPAAVAVAVILRVGLLHVGVGQRAGDPVPAVSRDFRVGVEVVERDELALQRALVRRRFLTEEVEAGIAVALAEAAKDLVEGPVLLDDVEDVLNGV